MNSVIAILVFLCSAFISSVSQVMLKKGAMRTYTSRIREYANPLVIGAYVLFLVATLVTVFAYRYVPLSLGPVLEASGYVFVGILGYLFLKEKLGKRKIAGMLLIVVGVAIAAI